MTTLKYVVNYLVTIEFPSNDRLVDLKLAFLESKLEDLYDGIIFEVQHNSDHKPIKVNIQFRNQEDHLHWLLSQPMSMFPSQLILTIDGLTL